ncbi:MAG TPA: Ig-like domain-containing protein, partial [Candidatus Anammoximicrobium sp.]|nr:Ig-like domain-containing protein [Candidatus Anammoximicrobium sp.]
MKQGIFNSGTLTVANSILWMNDSGDLNSLSNVVLSSSLVGVDPRFVRNPSNGGDGWGDNPQTAGVDESANDDYGDLRLTGQSPAIDYGDNSLLPLDSRDLDQDGVTNEPIPLDRDGQVRISGPRVDCGAYEFAGAVAPGRETPSSIVTTADDAFDLYDGAVSLSEAIYYAGVPGVGTAITFDSALNGQTILLGGAALYLDKSVSIDASSLAAGLTIDAQQSSRVLAIVGPAGQQVEIRGLTLTGGAADYGAGIYSPRAKLTIVHSTISHNTASASGGGVYSAAPLTITNSTFSGNVAKGSDGHGGGIYSSSTLTVTNSTLSNNETQGYYGHGGGIYATGTLSVTGSTLSGNAAKYYGSGGGLYGSGTVSVTTSTFSGNSANRYGGGIYGSGTVSITNATLLENSAGSGGGIYAYSGTTTITGSAILENNASYGGGFYNNSASTVIRSSTIAGNTASSSGGGVYRSSGSVNLALSIVAQNYLRNGNMSDLAATVTSGGYNLVGDQTGMSGLTHDVNHDLVGSYDLPLDPLFVKALDWGDDHTWGTADDASGDYHLKSNSPAVDTGSNALLPAGYLVDLQGAPRIVNGVVDRGAYERTGSAFRLSLAPESDTGKHNTDRLTSDIQPKFHIYTTALGTLELDFDGDGTIDLTQPLTLAGQHTVQSNVALSDGLRVVTATLNLGPDTTPLDDSVRFTLDTDSPGLAFAPDSAQAPVYELEITLDEAYDAARLAEFAGTVALGDGTLVNVNAAPGVGRNLKLSLPAIATAGPGTLTITDGIYDLAGNRAAALSHHFLVWRDVTRPAIVSVTPQQPVKTDIAQLTVQFTEEIALDATVPSDFSVLFADGSVQPSSQISAVFGQRGKYVIEFQPPISAAGSHQLVISAGVTDLAGNPLLGNGWDLAYTQDFEATVGGEWSSRNLYYHADLTRTLGRYSNDTVSLFLSGLPQHARLRVEWDLILLDSLGGYSTGWNANDVFALRDGQTQEVLWQHSFSAYTPTDTGNWGSIFAGEVAGIRYRGLAAEWSHSGSTLDLDFFDTGFDGIHDESWAIDNVRVYVLNSDSDYSAAFTIDRTPPRVVAVKPTEVTPITPPLRSFDVTFSEPIADGSFTGGDVTITNPVGANVPSYYIGTSRLTVDTYRVTISATSLTSLAGAYHATIGTGVFDLAGSALDQDG